MVYLNWLHEVIREEENGEKSKLEHNVSVSK